MIVSCQGEMESNTTWFSEAKRGVGANSYLIIEHDMMGGKSVPLLNLFFIPITLLGEYPPNSKRS